MVEERVFLSILVDEWFLIPECWLSLDFVNSHSPQLLNPYACGYSLAEKLRTLGA
jgi:hypothetical protein